MLLQVGAHLRFVLPGLHQCPNALMGFSTDLAGLAQAIQFGGVLAQAHRMQDRTGRR